MRAFSFFVFPIESRGIAEKKGGKGGFRRCPPDSVRLLRFDWVHPQIARPGKVLYQGTFRVSTIIDEGSNLHLKDDSRSVSGNTEAASRSCSTIFFSLPKTGAAFEFTAVLIYTLRELRHVPPTTSERSNHVWLRAGGVIEGSPDATVGALLFLAILRLAMNA